MLRQNYCNIVKESQGYFIGHQKRTERLNKAVNSSNCMKTQKWNTRLASYERKLIRKIGIFLKRIDLGKKRRLQDSSKGRGGEVGMEVTCLRSPKQRT